MLKAVPDYIKEEIDEQFELEKLADPAKLLRFILSGRDAEQIVADVRRDKERNRYVLTYAGKTLIASLRGAIRDSQDVLARKLPTLVDLSLEQVQQVLEDPRASRPDKLKAANLVMELTKFILTHQRKAETGIAPLHSKSEPIEAEFFRTENSR